MRNGFTRSILAATALSVASIPAAAQVSPLPRTPDGKPNLQGIWQVLSPAAWDIQDHQARLGAPAGQGVVEGNEIPYQPQALARKQENFANRLTADPDTKGYLPGVPRIMYMPFPFQIFQTPGYVAMAFEYAHGIRTIHTDGTAHPRGPINWWMGDSRGRWEGDTLVVDVTNFNGRSWFDDAGNFYSDGIRAVERWTMIDADAIHYEVTLDDPRVFTRPWKMAFGIRRNKEPGYELFESACHEGNRSFEGMLDAGLKPYVGVVPPK